MKHESSLNFFLHRHRHRRHYAKEFRNFDFN